MRETITLGGPFALPASGRDPRSIVILLHGYGSNGGDLMGLVPYWQAALPDTAFFSPNAPQPCPGVPDGYQWWSLSDLSRESRAAGVRNAAPAVDAFIDARLGQYGLSEDRLALVGFSQGTMMALHVAPRRARTLAGVVGYSGMLADPEALQADVRTRPPLLLVHGEADQMIPFQALHQAETAFRSLGFEIATHACAGLGHGIDEAGLRLGRAFHARVFDGAP